MKRKPKANCLEVPITAGIITGDSNFLFESTTVLPEQFFPLPSPTQPEKQLMLAVLKEAIHCWQKGLVGNLRRRERRLMKEAEEWLQSNDATWSFSCAYICEALGINQAYLCAKLTQIALAHGRLISREK